jgi:hypothetical protein
MFQRSYLSSYAADSVWFSFPFVVHSCLLPLLCTSNTSKQNKKKHKLYLANRNPVAFAGSKGALQFNWNTKFNPQTTRKQGIWRTCKRPANSCAGDTFEKQLSLLHLNAYISTQAELQIEPRPP